MNEPREFRFVLFVFAWTCAGLGLAGCSSKPVPQEDRAAFNLRKIAQAYELATDLRRRPPRNVEDLQRQFKELGETGDPDQLLRSPRDGQLFVILYGADFDADARDTVLAYEKDGAEGTRYVLTLARVVKQLKNEEFARATFAKDHKPSK